MPDAPSPFHANPRRAPDDVWARVREDYLSGLPATVVCQRHGVGLTAMRNRAARDGWRRADAVWTPPQTLDPDDEGLQLDDSVGGDLDRIELSQLTHVAMCRMMRAVLRGQATEALRWRRVRLVLEAEAAIEARLAEQEQRLWDYHHGPAATSPDPDTGHGAGQGAGHLD